MLDFADVVKLLKIAWVNWYCKANDRHWCALLDSPLHVSKVGGTLLFQCNYDLNYYSSRISLFFIKCSSSLARTQFQRSM